MVKDVIKRFLVASRQEILNNYSEIALFY